MIVTMNCFLLRSAAGGMHVGGARATPATFGNGRQPHSLIMADLVPKKTLKDGNKMPVLGLGTYLGGGKDVSCALKCGYRLIDTATLYE